MTGTQAWAVAALLAAATWGAEISFAQQTQPQTGRQSTSAQEQKTQQSSDFQAASTYKGMKINSPEGKEVGKVDEVLVDAQRGQLAYIVLTRGGFGGMGQEKYIVPWNAVTTDPEGKGLTLSVPREKLRLAPPGDEVEKQLTREMGQEISQHYGVAPYWEASSGQQPAGQQPQQTSTQPAQPPPPQPQQPQAQPQPTQAPPAGGQPQ